MLSDSNLGNLPAHYKLGKVYTSAGLEIQQIHQNELNYYNKSIYLKPTNNNPVFIKKDGLGIAIYPSSTIWTNIKCNIVVKPTAPNWAYVVVNGKALYNSTGSASSNFDLHEAEENNLVMRILELAGITLKDQVLNQTALRDQQTDKAEKNN